MTDLAGRGPLGQKTGKAGPKPRKPLPKQSAKRRAYMASRDRKAGLVHMGKVAAMPCLVCGCYGGDVHHEGKPRNDMNVLPLCPQHHRREFGAGAYHYSPKAFYALHGSSADLLARVAALIK
jgi:hypothetical protein